MSKLSEDRRIDPRLKALFGEFDLPAQPIASSREEILEQANSEEAKAMRDGLAAFFALCDTEEIAPSDGLTITTETFTSSPDGNTINIQLIKPESDEPLPGGLLHPRRRDGVDVLLRPETTRHGVGSSPSAAWRWRWSISATA